MRNNVLITLFKIKELHIILICLPYISKEEQDDHKETIKCGFLMLIIFFTLIPLVTLHKYLIKPSTRVFLS